MSHQEDLGNLDNSPTGDFGSIAKISEERASMPASVIVAAVAVGVIVAENTLITIVAFIYHNPSLILNLFQLGIACLILLGILSGHRLAWQWGRILAILGAILMSLGIIAYVTFGVQFPGLYEFAVALIVALVILIIIAGPLYVVFFALGRPSAKVFYGLICPKCGATTNKAADFFFNKARCRSCGEVWR